MLIFIRMYESDIYHVINVKNVSNDNKEVLLGQNIDEILFYNDIHINFLSRSSVYDYVITKNYIKVQVKKIHPNITEKVH
jgi:hypothetical protein